MISDCGFSAFRKFAPLSKFCIQGTIWVNKRAKPKWRHDIWKDI